MARHKTLKSISHNFSHSFISLLNHVNGDYFMGHLTRQARITNQSALSIDILKKTAQPTELLTNEIKASIDHWNNWFPELVEKGGSSMEFVKSATMKIEFDFRISRPYGGIERCMESPYFCEIIIIDDRGKEYKRKHEDYYEV
jgi:hypothetical protein